MSDRTWNFAKRANRACSPTFIIFLLLTACAVSASAQETPENVLDYYELLPARYLPVIKDVKNRIALIKVKDVKNGYLRLEGNWEGYAEVALWSNKSQQEILGVVQTICAPVCVQNIHFVKREGRQWLDVTRKALPQLTDRMLLERYNVLKQKDDENYTESDMLPFLYVLPRIGTTINVVVDPHFAARPTTLFSLIFLSETLTFVKTTPKTR